MTNRTARVSGLLLAIREAMEQAQLWSEHAPSAEALASTQPFCVDSLQFTEWVQWLMIPRLQMMIEQQLPLPQNSNMHAMAEEAFKPLQADTDRLLTLIRELDEALNIHH